MLEKILLNLLNTNEIVRFTNTYRGMPVSNNGQAVRVRLDRATFKVPKTQIICIRNDRLTYINSKTLLKIHRAHLVVIDWKNETVELDNFIPVDTSIGNRSLVRVETPKPIPAYIHFETTGELVTGNIIEISIRGVAISINADIVRKNKFTIGDSVLLRYTLPIVMKEDEPPVGIAISYDGIVRNIFEGKLGLKFRIGIQVKPDANIENIITKFVAQRQNELLKEIRQLANEEILV